MKRESAASDIFSCQQLFIDNRILVLAYSSWFSVAARVKSINLMYIDVNTANIQQLLQSIASPSIQLISDHI